MQDLSVNGRRVFEVNGTETRETKRGNKLQFCFSDCLKSILGRVVGRVERGSGSGGGGGEGGIKYFHEILC